MSNTVKQFMDPAGTYTGAYTSDTMVPTPLGYRSFQLRAIIQVEITSGTVDLQMRLTPDASWVTVTSYTTNSIEEVVMANEMRVVVTGVARAWLGEVT